MNILALVRQGIKTIKSNAGNALITVQVKKKTGNTYVNGKNTVTFASPKTLTGVISKFKDTDVDGINVKVTDVLILLFIDDNNDSPTIGDEVIHQGKIHQVVKPNPTWVGNVIVTCEVQLRT